MVVGDLAESTEVAVIGGGPGGYVAAIRLAQLGKEVTLISEDSLPGGECLLRGCIPSKALIEAGNLFRKIPEAKLMGIEAGEPRLDVGALQAWKDGIPKKMGTGVLQLLKQHGIPYLQARAKFLNPHNLEVRGADGIRRIQFQQAIVATGSFSTPLAAFPFDGKRILSSEHALNLQEIPSKLLVIGGGYIGLELGEVYAKFGSAVSVVEATDDLLPGLDADLKRPLKKRLKALGITVHLQTKARAWKEQKGEILVSLEGPEGKNMEQGATHILVAVGRSPRSAGFGLETTGVKVDAKGFIPVNERCQTNISHLYAIGDVAGGMMLAHKASREGIVAASNIAGEAEAFDNQVPAVIFTDPEIAYVGMSAGEAEARGIETATGIYSFAALGRALTLNEPEGFIKVVAEKKTNRILGVQMTGPHVSDLISEATLAIEMGASAEDLALTIHPHPTLSEALLEAAEGVMGMSIHRYQKKRV